MAPAELELEILEEKRRRTKIREFRGDTRLASIKQASNLREALVYITPSFSIQSQYQSQTTPVFLERDNELTASGDE